jgi:hypothetical protein
MGFLLRSKVGRWFDCAHHRLGKSSTRFAKSRYWVALFLFVFLLAACESEVEETPTAEPQQSPSAANTAAAERPPTESAPTELPPTEAAVEEPTAEPAAATAEPESGPDLLNGSWTEAADMLTNRSEMPAVTLAGLIYVPGGFGGEERLEVYDPQADEWTALADMPEGRHHLMAAGYNGRLYLFGGADSSGWQPTTTTWVYDPEADSWTELAPMPEARLAGAAVTLGDFLYVMGGTGGTQALLRYDPAADSWLPVCIRGSIPPLWPWMARFICWAAVGSRRGS